jgi:hypothetical protein
MDWIGLDWILLFVLPTTTTTITIYYTTLLLSHRANRTVTIMHGPAVQYDINPRTIGRPKRNDFNGAALASVNSKNCLRNSDLELGFRRVAHFHWPIKIDQTRVPNRSS